MRAVVQRVTHAQVQIAGETVGSIGQGLLVLLGVKAGDTEKDGEYIAGKLVKLRIFEDENGKMNRSVLDRHAVRASTSRGRPSTAGRRSGE